MSEAKSEEQRVTWDWHLSADKINHLQEASIESLTHLAKQAHYVDVRVRINGEYKWFQIDWLKHLEKVT